jgi:outer membrane protein OmpA-like peptidoglycan-associated protein/tetratricopeptide (TPR) repeat protein
MKNRRLKTILILFISIITLQGFSQSPGKLFKQGKKAASQGKTDEAIDLFTKVLEQKPNDDEVLIERAKQHEIKKENQQALDDYKKALDIDDGDQKLILKTTDLAIMLEKYYEALIILNKLFAEDKSNIDALERKAWCQIKLKSFTDALETTDYALDRNQYNFRLHYYKALAKDSLKDYATAGTEYQRAITILKGIKPNDVKPQPIYKPYFRNLAMVQYKLGAYDDAIKNYSTASTLDLADTIEPKNYRIFYDRSFAYLMKVDFTNAIGDLNKAIVMNEADKEPIYQRGVVYKKTSQYQSAINDFTKCVQLDAKDAEAFGNRGKCYMELSNYKEAIADFKKAATLGKDPQNEKLLADAKQKLYDANKENDAPDIKIEYPVIDINNFINVFENQFNVLVEGHIKDKSTLEFIKINGVTAKYNLDDVNPDFRCYVPLKGDIRKLDIVVSDIYHNQSAKTIKVGRLINDSKVKVTFSGKILSDDDSKAPYNNRDVYLVNEKGEVFFVSKTDNNGHFEFTNLPYDQPYFLTMDVNDTPLAQKNKFIITDENNTPILASAEDGKQHFKFSILPSDYNTMSLMSLDDAPLAIDIKGKLVVANDNKTPLANITVILMDGKGEAIARKKTDPFGVFLFSKLVPKENYSIKTDSLESQTLSYTKILVTDEYGKIIKELTKNPSGFFTYTMLLSERIQLSKISEVDPWLKTLKLSKEKNELVIIENIYYPSGSFEILPEAETVLVKAIDALKANPKLMLEVQSHTDAVAGDDYNMELSQKRANTVVEYFVLKGIDKKRLTAKGFGEMQLTNHCTNGVECSDAEHKQNRRTVFKINYMGN